MTSLTYRRIAPRLVVFTALLCAGLAAAPRPVAQALPKDGQGSTAAGTQPARIRVLVTGFRSDQGKALVALFRKAAAFPQQVEEAEQRAEGAIANRKAEIVFEQVLPGELALSVLHDEDNDRACRIGLLGIPKEGLGFSRNVRARFGPPKFQDAKLDVQPGARITLAIHMRYYGL